MQKKVKAKTKSVKKMSYAPLKNADDSIQVFQKNKDGENVPVMEMTRAQAVATMSQNRRGLLMIGPDGPLKWFASPAHLWEAACDYFEWADANPKIVYEVIKSGERSGDLVPIPKERPYTFPGFAQHIGCASATVLLYLKRKGFETVGALIEQAIYTRKYEGAAVGIYNAPMMIRDMGLVERSESETTTTVSGTIGLVAAKMNIVNNEPKPIDIEHESVD